MANTTVHVSGEIGDMGGLEESQAAFRKHHKNVGDVLNNMAEGLKKDEDRPDYEHQSYPKMVYHAERGERIVHTSKDLKAAIEEEGYRIAPYAKPKVYVADPETEKKQLLETNNRLRAQVIDQNETIEKQNGVLAGMMDRLEKLEQGADSKSKK